MNRTMPFVSSIAQPARPVSTRVSSLALLLIVFVALAGCETTSPKQDTGTIVGAIIGGLVGAALGDEAGAALGVVIGAGLGNQIGERLDEADRHKAEQAANAALALPAGETVEWRSDKVNGPAGTVTALKAAQSTSEGVCRNVREVVVIDGEEIDQTSTFCKSPQSGRWKLAG